MACKNQRPNERGQGLPFLRRKPTIDHEFAGIAPPGPWRRMASGAQSRSGPRRSHGVFQPARLVAMSEGSEPRLESRDPEPDERRGLPVLLGKSRLFLQLPRVSKAGDRETVAPDPERRIVTEIRDVEEQQGGMVEVPSRDGPRVAD